jgi:tyrosyl-tRNA synthetase
LVETLNGKIMSGNKSAIAIAIAIAITIAAVLFVCVILVVPSLANQLRRRTRTGTPVLWGISASKDSLHLGHHYSLHKVREHPTTTEVIIYIEDRTGGMDPFGSPGKITKQDIAEQRRNVPRLMKVIRRALPDHDVTFVRQSQFPESPAESDYIARCSDPNYSCEAHYPQMITDSHLRALEWLGVRDFTWVCGADQTRSTRAMGKEAARRNMTVTAEIHPLVKDPETGEKMGKRNHNAVWVPNASF